MRKQLRRSIIITAAVIMLLVLIAPAAFASGGNYHKVRYGETLYSIGRQYGVRANTLAKVNNLYNPNYIYAGQVLYVPTHNNNGYGYGHNNGYNNHNRYNNHYGSNSHRVVRGETLSSIAYRYGTSVWAIAKHNNIYNTNHIYAGQVLYIPSGY